MDSQEENELLHNVLEEMYENFQRGQPIYLIFLRAMQQHKRYALHVIASLINRGLAYNSNATDKNMLALTSRGIEVVREGGYLTYLNRQQQLANQQHQQEQARLLQEQAVASATISAADAAVESAQSSKSSTRAAWVAAIATVLGIVISLYSLYQSSQIDELKADIHNLQKQVQTLKK